MGKRKFVYQQSIGLSGVLFVPLAFSEPPEKKGFQECQLQYGKKEDRENWPTPSLTYAFETLGKGFSGTENLFELRYGYYSSRMRL